MFPYLVSELELKVRSQHFLSTTLKIQLNSCLYQALNSLTMPQQPWEKDQIPSMSFKGIRNFNFFSLFYHSHVNTHSTPYSTFSGSWMQNDIFIFLCMSFPLPDMPLPYLFIHQHFNIDSDPSRDPNKNRMLAAPKT